MRRAFHATVYDLDESITSITGEYDLPVPGGPKKRMQLSQMTLRRMFSRRWLRKSKSFCRKRRSSVFLSNHTRRKILISFGTCTLKISLFSIRSLFMCSPFPHLLLLLNDYSRRALQSVTITSGVDRQRNLHFKLSWSTTTFLSKRTSFDTSALPSNSSYFLYLNIGLHRYKKFFF